ncbi:putative ripening-related protein 2 [Ananas comosus]|uniref:Putative ripening-related protein 2 n=1 Tax=Ananas comosus TaxID=4615 RepID=A0A199VKU5_ANACO|nr:putative ripening-related protein 2 [Ananas comosus]
MGVALLTGWFDHSSCCLKNIRISANRNSVLAKVVHECDSANGCDNEHDFEQPCSNNIVDTWPAVRKALRIPKEVGEHHITWSDV